MGYEDDALDDREEDDKCTLEEASQTDVEEAIESIEDREGIVVGS
ncbi:hypothetical protein OB955_09300 [Halobacteria archaeon AArc-m2/3/4]|uniref:Uncharacterized protein n=1 Tax=Natronoglomus mannanivorans TaxID=2979990 RepID=A0ABT2QDC2_9EURY|nr:hypothetical protein [Halobacteria archaeon AArc-m2/3/4]